MGKWYHLFLRITIFGFSGSQRFFLATRFENFVLRAFPHAKRLQQDHACSVGNARSVLVESNIEDHTAEIGLFNRYSSYVTFSKGILSVDECVKLLAQISANVLILGGKIGRRGGEFLLLPFAVPPLPLCIAECHICLSAP